MPERSNSTLSLPAPSSADVLTDILRDGAQRMLAQAIEAEVAEWIDVARPVNERGRPPPGGSQRLPAQADDYSPASARSRSSSRACSIDGRPAKPSPFPPRFCLRTCERRRAWRS